MQLLGKQYFEDRESTDTAQETMLMADDGMGNEDGLEQLCDAVSRHIFIAISNRQAHSIIIFAM